MRALQKLVRNGNATSITIPRPFLIHLGWLPGETRIVEVTEDGSLLVRIPTARDFAPQAAPRILPEPTATGGK